MRTAAGQVPLYQELPRSCHYIHHINYKTLEDQPIQWSRPQLANVQQHFNFIKTRESKREIIRKTHTHTHTHTQKLKERKRSVHVCDGH